MSRKLNHFSVISAGRMKTDSIEYSHCQQCYDQLEGIAQLIEELVNSGTISSDTSDKLNELNTKLIKLFRKLETS